MTGWRHSWKPCPKAPRRCCTPSTRCTAKNGVADENRTSFFVPNRYAKKLAESYPVRFEWVASIHPYRKDCEAELERCHAQGAVAIKWLPSSMGIDPASPLCDRFYRKAAELNLPLISHGGVEKSVHGANRQEFNNALSLRRALDAGLRVIVAHCATLGNARDENGKIVRSFDLFARLMAETQWQGQLFGDISAITLRNREMEVIKTLVVGNGLARPPAERLRLSPARRPALDIGKELCQSRPAT